MLDQVRQAMLSLAPLLRRRGTSLEVGKALRRAGQQMDKCLLEPNPAGRAAAVRSAVAELRASLALIHESSQAADHQQLEGTARALSILAPFESSPVSGTDAPLEARPAFSGGVGEFRPRPASLPDGPPENAPLPSPLPVDLPGEAVPAQPGIMMDLVEESFGEAEFLWQRWEDGLVSHARDLRTLAFFIEERLQGALDGVRLAADAAFEPFLSPALSSDSPGPLTAAAHIAATAGSGPAHDTLLAMLDGADGVRLACLRRALEVLDSQGELAPFEARLAAGGLEQKAALVELRAFRRLPLPPVVDELARAPDPRLRAMALKAARHAAPETVLPAIEYFLGDADPSVRNAAMESGVILGLAGAWSGCLELVRRQDPSAAPLLLIVGLLGTEADQANVLSALGNEPLRRSAIFAAGFSGTRSAADACVAAMAAHADAQLAAEAVCAITGLNLEDEDLVRPEQEEDASTSEVTELTPEYLLPRPDVAGVKRWWDANRSRFSPGVRYLHGQPVSLRGLQAALERGPMRRRHAIALELAARTGGKYDVCTRAFTHQQLAQLRAFESVVAGAAPSPLSRCFSPA